STSLPGSFNVQNAALALVMVLESGVPVPEVVAALGRAGGMSAVVPGRMEVIAPGDESTPQVIVDFAHNTEALREALDSLRHRVPGRLVVVFGAAGERDQGKRPLMGAAAAAGADLVILTDDDPYAEDPARIRADVRGGIPTDARVQEIPDRRAAIAAAIAQAGPTDTVLIAGRGHETVQPVAGHEIELDDRVEARAALSKRALGERDINQRDLAKQDLTKRGATCAD
ncbi:MAG: hypothetical protein FWG11_06285, partial [Promicromonosporaceae bacterium]|nr:hypothetical protein [Promicromonosporaceae bacterium]